jgi:transposase
VLHPSPLEGPPDVPAKRLEQIGGPLWPGSHSDSRGRIEPIELVSGRGRARPRTPLKKLGPDEAELLRLLQRWRDEVVSNGHAIERIVVAYKALAGSFANCTWDRSLHHPFHQRCRLAEHRRAKTDRPDTAMLLRVFTGRLHGERGYCGMVAVPTIDDEDAKRPHRERENLVGERTRIIYRMKAALIRLGIRGFKPELRRAPKKLDGLRSPEDLPIPPHKLDEIRRDRSPCCRRWPLLTIVS